MKLTFIVITLFIYLCSSITFSQDTTFYDVDWNNTTKDKASYFFTKPYLDNPYPEMDGKVDTLKNNHILSFGNRSITKIDFCFHLIPDKFFIGKKVKIYNNGHAYRTLNLSNDIDWPSEEIREKSGENFPKWKAPKDGDTVEICWVFNRFPSLESRKNYPDIVYIVKYKDYFVPVSGKGLTMIDHKQYQIESSTVTNTTTTQHKIPISYVLAPGLIYQNQLFGELNLLFAKIECAMCAPCVIYGPYIGVESNFNSKNHIYGFKAGYQIAMLPISLRGSVVNYMDNKQSDLRLLPEIGLSFLGIVNLNYGYNIPLLAFQSNSIAKHRLSLVINLSRELW